MNTQSLPGLGTGQAAMTECFARCRSRGQHLGGHGITDVLALRCVGLSLPFLAAQSNLAYVLLLYSRVSVSMLSLTLLRSATADPVPPPFQRLPCLALGRRLWRRSPGSIAAAAWAMSLHAVCPCHFKTPGVPSSGSGCGDRGSLASSISMTCRPDSRTVHGFGQLSHEFQTPVAMLPRQQAIEVGTLEDRLCHPMQLSPCAAD